MQPKQVIWSLIILNAIFFMVFASLARTTIFDQWLTNKVVPNLCTEKQVDGSVVFKFCEEDSVE